MSSDMECYRQALNVFLAATKDADVEVAVDLLPRYVRLHLDGTWEITQVPSCNLHAAFYESGKIVPHGICLPLVLPLSEEALVACLEEKRFLVEAKEQEDAFYRDVYED
ncbi:hypothetical protein KDA_74740 [Dictyobacter alpinus]|uniref:Uncharacterized protein n=1 Tax=Dictyobacter alpinus TaxID=2014873 RepID=A0A402BKZ8_9CHLR|nr:hypothetical protein [Dictyobacter alpinus]GCE31990.1 hypothetical protein KDA_74740 [Dictyobacter alpinus]